MRHYYTADQIRAAEAPVLAALPDGALMRRAASGLATAVAAELRRRAGGGRARRVRGGRIRGQRRRCAVGGDLPRRRGVAAYLVLLNPGRTHAKALAAFRAAGGRVVGGGDVGVPDGTDLVIDGVVGISGTGPLRPAAAAIFAAVGQSGVPVVAVDIPSGIDVHTGAIAPDPRRGPD